MARFKSVLLGDMPLPAGPSERNYEHASCNAADFDFGLRRLRTFLPADRVHGGDHVIQWRGFQDDRCPASMQAMHHRCPLHCPHAPAIAFAPQRPAGTLMVAIAHGVALPRLLAESKRCAQSRTSGRIKDTWPVGMLKLKQLPSRRRALCRPPRHAQAGGMAATSFQAQCEVGSLRECMRRVSHNVLGRVRMSAA